MGVGEQLLYDTVICSYHPHPPPSPERFRVPQPKGPQPGLQARCRASRPGNCPHMATGGGSDSATLTLSRIGLLIPLEHLFTPDGQVVRRPTRAQQQRRRLCAPLPPFSFLLTPLGAAALLLAVSLTTVAFAPTGRSSRLRSST